MRKVLTPGMWTRITTNRPLLAQLPEWAKPVFCLTFAKAAALEPVIASCVTVPNPAPYIITEFSAYDASYLEFLNLQIELNARGDEWSALLRRRAVALEPYIGEMLLTIVLVKDNRRLRMKLRPPHFKLVYLEES